MQKLPFSSSPHPFVLGFGESGRAVVRALLQAGFFVTVWDDFLTSKTLCKEALEWQQQGRIRFCTSLSASLFHNIEFLIVSPGIAKEHPLYQYARQHHMKIIGEMEWAFQYAHEHQLLEGKKLIGVTGTNGKTSVLHALDYICNQLALTTLQKKWQAIVVGNEAKPLSACLDQISKAHFILVEISSFQLETLFTPRFDAAVLLNITSDHLDRYRNFTDYAQTKCRISQLIKPTGYFYTTQSVLSSFYATQPRHTQFIIDTHPKWEKALSLIAQRCSLSPHAALSHNYTTAYLLLSQFGCTLNAFLSFCHSIPALAHRIEWIATIRGVHYYDDTKATNPCSVINSIIALDNQPILLITGGKSKICDYSSWPKAMKNRIKAVFVMGKAGKEIALQLQAFLPVISCSSLSNAMQRAQSRAEKGDLVLLSPGSANTDQFDSYKACSQAFKNLLLTSV